MIAETVRSIIKDHQHMLSLAEGWRKLDDGVGEQPERTARDYLARELCNKVQGMTSRLDSLKDEIDAFNRNFCDEVEARARAMRDHSYVLPDDKKRILLHSDASVMSRML